jgi:hypothetical protein
MWTFYELQLFFETQNIESKTKSKKCYCLFLLQDVCGMAMNVIAIIYMCLASLEDEVNSKSAKDRRSAELSFLVSSAWSQTNSVTVTLGAF